MLSVSNSLRCISSVFLEHNASVGHLVHTIEEKDIMVPNFCNDCGTQNKQTARFCRGCGISLTLPNQGQTRSLTDVIHNGQYQIVRLLGQGGFGAVYLAKDLFLGNRQVAIKEMILQNLPSSEIAGDIAAFKREALLLAGLRHPNLLATE